jgi:hypothetical protein
VDHGRFGQRRFLASMIEKVALSKFGTLICIAGLSAAAACAIAFCTYRAILPLEIDPNEAWNAWNSAAIEHLYPDFAQLTINNYPPLYFYMQHMFFQLGLERIYTGRLASILSSLLLSFLVYRTVRVLGATRLGAAAGAIWFLATLAGAYTGYVGMNDPHLPGLALMCAGFLWFVARQQKGKATEPAVLLMVLAGFVKHSLVAIPASAFVWLAFVSPHRAVRAVAIGMAACALGLIICHVVYGRNFIEQLTLPRAMGAQNSRLAITSLLPLAAGGAVVTTWLLNNLRDRLAKKVAVFVMITLASGFVQKLGDGVDVNAYFEVLFALAAGVGIAFGSSQALPLAGASEAGRHRLVFAAVLLLGVSISYQSEPYRLMFSGEFRAEVAENVEAVATEVKRVRRIPGNVSCSVMLVCYWAGKPFVWDDFAMRQRVATGRWTQKELDQRARAKRIKFETIDDKTVW